jgi:hypothetical protein
MKKIRYFIILSLIFFIASCQKDNEIEFYDLGTEFFISGSFTSLDNEATISIDNQQKNLSEVKLTHLGGLTTDLDADDNPIPFTSDYTATIPISNGAGDVTISDADLGMTELGWSADFQFDADYDGKHIMRFFTLTVDDPITTDAPLVSHRADTIYHFKFFIEPVSAVVETVTVQTKVSVLGTYVNLPGTFNAVDSIPIDPADYIVGDTLFVNVIGTVGSKTAETETEIVIGPVTLNDLATFILDDTIDQAYDFIVGDFVSVSTGGESADIEMTASYTLDGLKVGFASNQHAEFVMGTSFDYENADSLAIYGTDFSAAITSNDNVAGGEVYFFRTKRGSDPYFYGIMKVIKVDKPQGILEDSYIEFEFKY